MSTRRVRRQRGVTLVELIIFIVIIGIALTGVLGVFTYATSHSADPLRHKQALMLAESLLEEVELAQFTVCEPGSANAENATSCGVTEAMGPEPGDVRPYDNVNDYWAADGQPFTDKVTGKILDATGTAFPLSDYSVNLAITQEDLQGISGSTNGDVLHIAITVTYDGGRQVRLDGYRTRYAPKVG